MKYELKVPEVGESITEVTIAQWLKKDGEQVDSETLVCEIESDKASFELPAEKEGVLKILIEEGENAAVGATIAEIETDGAVKKKKEGPSQAKDQKEEDEEKIESEERDHETKQKITPVAKNILEKSGIKTEEIKGTGQGGTITKEDALKAVEKRKSSKPEARSTFESEDKSEETMTRSETSLTAARQTERKRMSTLRKTISKRLVAAKNETAMLTTFNEVDMSSIIQIRKKYKDIFQKKYDINLGFMSFFTRAVCQTLQEFPEINAQIDGDDIIYHYYYDIGIAVSTPRGLVVPVIRDAEKLRLHEIEKQIALLAENARENKLSIEEMTGGTFTITNGGVFGSLLATPIINTPQSAILGMHKILERPVALNGEVVIRPMMYLALSYDHRIVDGRESVSFLVRIKELLEDPNRLLLEI
jgi:2-oxoglutarate dehydrogenase E2 component (dihydrolipoamide succinyltransferase)